MKRNEIKITFYKLFISPKNIKFNENVCHNNILSLPSMSIAPVFRRKLRHKSRRVPSACIGIGHCPAFPLLFILLNLIVWFFLHLSHQILAKWLSASKNVKYIFINIFIGPCQVYPVSDLWVQMSVCPSITHVHYCAIIVQCACNQIGANF